MIFIIFIIVMYITSSSHLLQKSTETEQLVIVRKVHIKIKYCNFLHHMSRINSSFHSFQMYFIHIKLHFCSSEIYKFFTFILSFILCICKQLDRGSVGYFNFNIGRSKSFFIISFNDTLRYQCTLKYSSFVFQTVVDMCLTGMDSCNECVLLCF